MDNGTTEVYIIRHGQTDFNKKNIIQGRGVNAPINALGREQAHAFHASYGHLSFDAIFTSSLQRTQQTIQPFTATGLPHDPHTELDEIDWGIHEGQPTTPELHRFYTSIVQKWRQGQVDEKVPEGESPLELQARQLRFINRVLKKQRGRILICSHGRAMRSLLCTLLDVPLKDMDTFPHQNLSLYKLTSQNGHFRMALFNDVRHLPVNGKP